ncbi:MerR family transcriptional regulator [Actinopolymorpha sp. NPDC004070]|uniref:MerR family transcriptional regulator n=1 Tax=Actinopolymorpha sp. NPDC004070 TaxID=3154548 RepID=UPI0033ACC368
MSTRPQRSVDSSPDELLTIGAFARRSGLSMKALRLYDRCGLLKPADVDPGNGYRRYHASQLFTARLIEMLRWVDMPLTDIAEVVSAPGERGAEILQTYWDGVERRITGQRELVHHLRASILGGDHRFAGYEVRVRDVAEQLVLTECSRVRREELEGWADEVKRRLTSAARAYGGPSAELFVVFHGPVTKDNDGPVEVCVPIRYAPATHADATIRREPAHREAYTTITKAQFDMPQILSAYEAVQRWIDDHGLTRTGPGREVYIAGMDVDASDLDDQLCHVAYPIG